ncbi:MAG TPA: anti-sigma factor [Streptosporangiaceae bacterium]|nr:anti-sigma factor [Streptosporangiaceae bacterium]
MSHTDPEILALRALGETAGTAADAEHAASCAHCRAELARLAEVVRLARDTEPGEVLQAPSPRLWDRIAAAVGSPALNDRSLNGSANPSALTAAKAPAISAEPAGSEAPAVPEGSRGSRPGRPRLAWPRGRLASAMAGLAAGVIIGIGGGVGVAQVSQAPPARVVARIELSPLPQFPQWQGTTGTAVMRSTATQQEIVITLRAPARPGFYEAWLLARDGVSMISLGDLSAEHTGTFTVPPGVDLRDYSRIDISLQPFDGSTQHSKASVVRGALPPAAIG